jgi:hypothetical protein
VAEKTPLSTPSSLLAEELRVGFARFAGMFREYDLTDEVDIQSVREILVDLALDAHELLVEVRRWRVTS